MSDMPVLESVVTVTIARPVLFEAFHARKTRRQKARGVLGAIKRGMLAVLPGRRNRP